MDGTDLWPDANQELLGSLKGRTPFVNYMFFSNTPYWQGLQGFHALFECFHTNPVLFSTIMIKAREYSNMQIKVVNRNTGVEEPCNTRKDIPKAIYDLFARPNVLQSTWEFLLQRKIFEEVAGNSFTYGNFSLGMKHTIQNTVALWNVWPEHMKFKLRGNYFEATDISEIIEQWKFEFGVYKKTWEPHEILHKNKPNTDISNGLIFGRSTACSLSRPLSNIAMAYESRNVMMKNRGMRVIFTSDKGDDSGRIPLNDDEKTDLNNSAKEYGMLENQKQFFFTHLPLSATVIDQDVRKLGLFEEIATDAMIVANAYGVPEILLKLYLAGATFENQEASVRRLYQGTLIPEALDDMIAFNTFLGLSDTDWMIVPSFDHVPALQESEKTKAEAKNIEGTMAMNEFSKGLITLQEYRDRMGYGTAPDELLKQTTDEPTAANQ
jgi:hypothetical protein